MTPAIGDTFIIPDKRDGYVPHLWIVISDPSANPELVVLVSMTSFEEYKDCSCRIDAGEHPQAKHDSVIDYHSARMISAADLEAKSNDHKIRRREPVSEELLERILAGADTTQFIPNECHWILADQGLLPK